VVPVTAANSPQLSLAALLATKPEHRPWLTAPPADDQRSRC
jgi:hypothetical protein